jgi:hypothetical protein
MFVRLIFMLVALAVSAPLAAQEPKAIGVEEWREILDGVAGTDDDSVVNLATRYINESTALVKAGNRAGAMRKSLISLVLTRHVLDRKERAGRLVARRDVAAVNRLQITLDSAGMAPRLMEQSAANLGIVLQERPSAMVIRLRAMPRPATPAERTVMIAAIKSKLIDPAAPIFGRADIVANQACVTVNAKNRDGGYVGNKEAVLYLNPRTGAWTSGGLIAYPHGMCLDTVE